MKFPTLTLGFAGIAALASLSTASAVDTELCSPLQAAVTKAVTAAPESVLKVVAEQVAASPKCACEIVKAAIAAAKADNATVVAIVEAAAAAAPDQLPVVLACAAAAAPQAAAALADKFGAETEGSGKGVVGKEPVGKMTVPGPIVEEEYSEDFGFVRPGVGGIYLTIPNGAASGEPIIIEKEVIVTKIVRRPGRPVNVPVEVTVTVPVPVFVPVPTFPVPN